MILYTNLEQSRELFELGIDPDTADFIWTTDLADQFFKYPVLDWRPDKCFIDGKSNLPCWSFGALVKLMPDEIKGDGNTTQRLMVQNTCISYFDETGMAHGPCFYGEDMMRHAIKMIEWLVKNNKI